ncbi:MAG: hypothetical protein ACXWXN_07735 [Actinomycetota bacterium]
MNGRRTEDSVGKRWILPILLVAAMAAGSLIGPATASADGPRGLDYQCRLVATKLGEEIAVTFRLQTNLAHDRWRVRLYHEDELTFSKVRTTNAQGNLRVVRIEPNLPGRDDLAARARHLESGTTCEVETRI